MRLVVGLRAGGILDRACATKPSARTTSNSELAPRIVPMRGDLRFVAHDIERTLGDCNFFTECADVRVGAGSLGDDDDF